MHAVDNQFVIAASYGEAAADYPRSQKLFTASSTSPSVWAPLIDLPPDVHSHTVNASYLCQFQLLMFD